MADKDKDDEFKDRLIENISTAIKQLQMKCCYQGNDVKFTGTMWQVQELCLHLDGTLSHGLKRIHGSYWPFVRELTHKSIVALILELPRAVSNFVRGWAWLYLALNDHALESYLRTVISHPKITKQHYLPHALLRDAQRLQVLVMMCAGLEHLPFQLEPDNACLSEWKSLMNEDESEKCDEDVEEADCASLVSCASSEDSQDTCDDPELGVIMIVTIDPKTGLPSKEDIIHSSTHGNRKRKKERPNSIHNNNNISIILPEETKNTASNGGVALANPLADGLSDVHLTMQDRELFLNSILHNETDSTRPNKINNLSENGNSADPSLHISKEFSEEASVYDRSYRLPNELGPEVACSISDSLEEPPAVILRPKNGDQKSAAKRVSFEPDNLINVMNVACIPDSAQQIETFFNDSESGIIPSLSERGVPEGQEDPMSSSTASLSYPVSDAKLKDYFKPTMLADLTAKQSGLLIEAWELFPKPIFVDKSVVETNVRQLEDELKSEVHLAQGQTRECMQGEVPLENNFHLMLMLEVVADQDEKVYKVFQATVAHTTGSPMNVYIVLTDKRFYMTHWDLNNKHYKNDALFLYSEIEFLQLSLNYQIINIVCVSPRRRFWLCTGDEEITRNIVSSLEVAIRRSPQVVSLPCIFTDSTAQSIAICKWIANETACKARIASVDHYALIKWEDPSAAESIPSPIGPHKEGDLMFRYVGPSVFGIEHWRPGYFRLKGGVCYQFSDSLDRTFRSYEQLLGGGCVGCHRVPNSDRPHTFELVLKGDRALQFAAPCEADASAWLQVFLTAMSQGFSDSERTPCVAACLILAAQKMFICHEELETHFITSLGKADVQDVSMVHLDPKGTPYCILEFDSVEATESCCDWALYFASPVELAKFLRALSDAWQSLYQVPLPNSEITDPALQKRF